MSWWNQWIKLQNTKKRNDFTDLLCSQHTTTIKRFEFPKGNVSGILNEQNCCVFLFLMAPFNQTVINTPSVENVPKDEFRWDFADKPVFDWRRIKMVKADECLGQKHLSTFLFKPRTTSNAGVVWFKADLLINALRKNLNSIPEVKLSELSNFKVAKNGKFNCHKFWLVRFIFYVSYFLYPFCILDFVHFWGGGTFVSGFVA